MEHARGSAQALALAGGGGAGKDASGDVLMGAVAGGRAATEQAPLLWSLQAERGLSELDGDWSRAAVLIPMPSSPSPKVARVAKGAREADLVVGWEALRSTVRG